MPQDEQIVSRNFRNCLQKTWRTARLTVVPAGKESEKKTVVKTLVPELTIAASAVLIGMMNRKIAESVPAVFAMKKSDRESVFGQPDRTVMQSKVSLAGKTGQTGCLWRIAVRTFGQIVQVSALPDLIAMGLSVEKASDLWFDLQERQEFVQQLRVFPKREAIR
jgi:hypothetical protein